MAAPTFSIIMAAYNAAATIDAAIASAEQQTFSDFELIIVDDGSTDATPQILSTHSAEDSRIRVTRQPNAGANAARNRALGMARGTYVTFLDTDDLKLPSYLARAAETFARHPGAGIAYSDSYILDDRTRRIYRKGYIESQRGPDPPPVSTEAVLAALVNDCFFPFSATAIRKSAIDSTGFFDPSIAGTDDLDLFLRVVLAGYSVARIPGRLAVMRRVDGQISGNPSIMLTNLCATYRKIVDNPAAPTAVRQLAAERIRDVQPLIERASAPVKTRNPLLQRAVDAAWRIRLSITWPRAWRISHPPAIREAFPDLRRRP